MTRRTVGLVAALATLLACDNTGPTDPPALTVIVDAQPPTVEVGDPATVTVSAFRPDGTPTAGAPVKMRSTLGRLARSQFFLDASGQGSTVLDSGSEPGTATVSAIVTVGGVESEGSFDLEVVVPEPPQQAIQASPEALVQLHSRSADPCPNPFEPAITITPVGAVEVNYRIVEDLPGWLTVDALSGPVPAEVVASYSCEAAAGDLDLAHALQIQALDPTTGEDVGEPVVVSVTLQVRD